MVKAHRLNLPEILLGNKCIHVLACQLSLRQPASKINSLLKSYESSHPILRFRLLITKSTRFKLLFQSTRFHPSVHVNHDYCHATTLTVTTHNIG